MVAPGIRRGNGFNADLCAEDRGAPPREQREHLRGCGGGRAPRGPGHGLWRSRGREAAGPGWRLLPCMGTDTRPSWPRSPGENKFSCRRRAAGAARGSGSRETGSEGRERSGMGFPEHPLWLKSPQNFEREISPVLYFTSPARTAGHAAGRSPLPASLWLHHKNLPSSSPLLILILDLVDGAVAITSHSFWLQKQRASRKQGN